MGYPLHDFATDITFTAAPGQKVFSLPCSMFPGYEGAYVVEVNGAALVYTPAAPGAGHFTTAAPATEGTDITLGAACAGGEQVRCYRSLPRERVSQLPESGAVSIAALNAELTRIVALIQDAVTEGVDPALAAGGGASLIGFTQPLSSIVRTISAKLAETVSVKDFGAVGNGVADDTAAIQAAINSGAIRILLPTGIYKVSALTMPSETSLVGNGPFAGGSVLRATTATGDVITTSGSGKNHIVGIYFDSSVTRTSGAYITMGGQGRGLVQACEFWNGKDGVVIDALDNITLDDLKLFSMTGDVIRIKQGFNHLLNYVHCDASPGSQPASGLRIDAVGDVTVSGCQFLHAGTALLIDVIAGGAINSVNIDQTYFDTTTTPGIIRSTNTGVIQRIDIANSWFGNGTNDGLSISKTGSGEVSGIAIHNMRACLNGGDGLKIGAGVTNVRVTGGQFSQNTGSGISAATGSELYLLGGAIGAADGLTGNAVGLTIASGATGYANGTKISGNTSNLSVSGTGFKLRNTVGALANNHGSASVTTSASGLASIAHGLSGTPAMATTVLVESGANESQLVSVDGTNLNIRIRNTTTDANVASATKTVMWEARL